MFTVICPTWNRGEALRPTLESVLAQTLRDFELVVVSDASTDSTDEVAADVAARDPRVRVMRTRRYGFQAGPTNEALRTARHDRIAYLDHDDLWAPEHLETLAGLLDSGADLVASRARKVDPTGRELSVAHPVTRLWHHEAQVLNPLFENSCAAHRRWLVDAVGGWTESEVGLEDWDLWLRMADAGASVATTMRTTVDVVEHPGSRQNGLPLRHAHVLAEFDDARSARAAVRRLTDRRLYPRAAAACTDDLLDWYRRLAERGELVEPQGWPWPGRVPRELVASHVADAGDRWQSLVVEPCEGGWSVGIPVGVMSAGHAERLGEVFREAMPRQRELLHEVLGGREPALRREVASTAVHG